MSHGCGSCGVSSRGAAGPGRRRFPGSPPITRPARPRPPRPPPGVAEPAEPAEPVAHRASQRPPGGTPTLSAAHRGGPGWHRVHRTCGRYGSLMRPVPSLGGSRQLPFAAALPEYRRISNLPAQHDLPPSLPGRDDTQRPPRVSERERHHRRVAEPSVPPQLGQHRPQLTHHLRPLLKNSRKATPITPVFPAAAGSPSPSGSPRPRTRYQHPPPRRQRPQAVREPVAPDRIEHHTRRHVPPSRLRSAASRRPPAACSAPAPTRSPLRLRLRHRDHVRAPAPARAAPPPSPPRPPPRAPAAARPPPPGPAGPARKHRQVVQSAPRLLEAHPVWHRNVAPGPPPTTSASGPRPRTTTR